MNLIYILYFYLPGLLSDMNWRQKSAYIILANSIILIKYIGYCISYLLASLFVILVVANVQGLIIN